MLAAHFLDALQPRVAGYIDAPFSLNGFEDHSCGERKSAATVFE
ncbi:Uncharacterised protein [Mycobacterium tuberculosis]|nr:Uncharacterised protein [Mycobacterium tuberculosis]